MQKLTSNKADIEYYPNIRLVLLLKKANLYWHPILAELTKIYPQTKVYTGFWPGFSWGYQDSFEIEQIGKIKFLSAYKNKQNPGYEPGLTYLSPKIVFPLLKSNPDLVFTDGFCIWTVIVLLLKIFTKWRVIIILDGSTPGVDYRNSWLRINIRRLMVSLADGFITNNKLGKAYLKEVLQVESEKIFARPYLVPDKISLQQYSNQPQLTNLLLKHPIFLCVGQIIPRKGIEQLLKACNLLNKDNTDFSLLIAGDGWKRPELEALTVKYALSPKIKWLGSIDYGYLGAYYQLTDVLIFPTFEDTWGMVVLEAMSFGKPIICSELAGSSELIVEGENGYCFNPHNIEQLVNIMRLFVKDPQIIEIMSNRSSQLAKRHSPKKAAKSITKAVSFVTDKCN